MSEVVDLYYFGDHESLHQVRGTVESESIVYITITQVLDGKRVRFPWANVQRVLTVKEQQ